MASSRLPQQPWPPADPRRPRAGDAPLAWRHVRWPCPDDHVAPPWVVAGWDAPVPGPEPRRDCDRTVRYGAPRSPRTPRPARRRQAGRARRPSLRRPSCRSSRPIPSVLHPVTLAMAMARQACRCQGRRTKPSPSEGEDEDAGSGAPGRHGCVERCWMEHLTPLPLLLGPILNVGRARGRRWRRASGGGPVVT